MPLLDSFDQESWNVGLTANNRLETTIQFG